MTSVESGRGWLLTAGVAALVMAAATAAAGGGRVLAVRDRIVTRGPDVLLADIADAAADLPREWLERTVMPSPTPGESGNFALLAVAHALHRYPDMHDTVLRGPSLVSVRREGVPLDTEKIKEAILAYAGGIEPWRGRLLLVVPDPKARPVWVAGSDVQVSAIGHVRRDGRSGLRFDLEVASDEAETRIVSINAEVRILEDVWTAGRFLDRGAVLNESDIVSKTLPDDEVRGEYIPVTDGIAGMEVVRSLRPGEAFCRHFLREPLCVEAGEWLTVTAGRGGIEVALLAKALGRGRRGERVLCVNEGSNRRLLVRLTGPKRATLEMQTGGMP